MRTNSQLGAEAVFYKTTQIDGLIDYCLRLREVHFGAKRVAR